MQFHLSFLVMAGWSVWSLFISFSLIENQVKRLLLELKFIYCILYIEHFVPLALSHNLEVLFLFFRKLNMGMLIYCVLHVWGLLTQLPMFLRGKHA